MKLHPDVTLRLERVEYMPAKTDMQPGILYYSARFDLAIQVCPCGCGTHAVTPIGPGEWSLTVDDEERATMAPSLLQQGCGVHWFVRAGKVVWT